MGVTWVIERGAFSDAYSAFAESIEREGYQRRDWDDDWWSNGRRPRFDHGEIVIFHGSLGNADRIPKELDWRPGAFCATARFHCSAWYESAKPWLLHDRWALSTVAELVASPHEVAGQLASNDQVFVRPDSPLKPFSGRVCTLTGLTLQALDHGFYYEDASIPIVVAPLRRIQREWRFVVADGKVAGGSAYTAETRSAAAGDAPTAVAQEIASALAAPEAVYVLDLCESDSGIKLVELNPFSGADLYACDPSSVLHAVSEVARKTAV